MGENGKAPHIIMIPPPFQGHLNPSIQLCLKLASKGFIITFVNTQWVHHEITKSNKYPNDDIFAGARGSGVDIRYATVSDGFPISFDRSLNRDQFVQGRLHVFPAHVDEIVGKLVAESDPPPRCMVVDTFSAWGYSVAKKYGLVFASFWTQPASVLGLFYHVDLLKENRHYCTNGGERNQSIIDYVPGVSPIEAKDLVTFFQDTDPSNPMHQLIHQAFTDVKKADFIICNTVQELEPEPISMLQQMQLIYTIGPLFPPQFNNQSVAMNLWSESDCSQWLDSKPHGSVLYASFGSYAHSNKKQLEEIANGLLHSGINFIWVLRPDIVNCELIDVLPNGFFESVKGRGLVLSWCKQNAVLLHPAVGGFLTHCGWNSILEGIWCGVPLICFPLAADQTTNRKLVVDDWKIGINLCDEKVLSSKEVAEKVQYFMSEETIRAMRNGIEEFRKKLKDALSEIGSSKRNFDQFVEDVKAKMKSKQEKGT